MNDLKCDFCSTPLRNGAANMYIVDGILSGELLDGRSFVDADGQWLACKTCDDLIAAKQWAALIDRAVDGVFTNPETRASAQMLGRDNVRERCTQVWGMVFGELFKGFSA